MIPPSTLTRSLRPWWDFFVAAGRDYVIDPCLLAAICLRESRGGLLLDPPGPAGKGDHGHGHGLMQIDDRSHLWFCTHEKWDDPESNIRYGASILAMELHRFRGDEFLAVCAYNAGGHAVQRALDDLSEPHTVQSEHSAADHVTTGGEYGSWVMAHRDIFRNALQKEQPK